MLYVQRIGLIVLLGLATQLTGCAGLQKTNKQPDWVTENIGKPISSLILTLRIPDKTYDIDATTKLYQWDQCDGIGTTDNAGKYSSSYVCRHIVAQTKNGIVESVKFKN